MGVTDQKQQHTKETAMKLLDQAIPIPSKRAYPTNSWMPPAGVRIISSDDHNMEVSHLFEERLPEKFRRKGPEL